jgi:formylglycine-generating enzyme required for sulfatase activity
MTSLVLTAAGMPPLDCVYVPAGPFPMGSDPRRDNFSRPEEEPQHEVMLSAYHIGRYPVTNAQFAAFAAQTDYAFTYPAGRDLHPVVHEHFAQVNAFCAWLAAENGLNVRLPSEAEWEKAARGDDGRLYPWGDAWDTQRLNSAQGGANETTPVAQYDALGLSPHGVADMVGNIWEWVSDWFDDACYSRRAGQGAVVDPHGPETGTHRVLRGASFYHRQSGARVARRHKYIPASRCYDIGFRVAVG